jgi:hypothetical protein
MSRCINAFTEGSKGNKSNARRDRSPAFVTNRVAGTMNALAIRSPGTEVREFALGPQAR